MENKDFTYSEMKDALLVMKRESIIRNDIDFLRILERALRGLEDAHSVCKSLYESVSNENIKNQ